MRRVILLAVFAIILSAAGALASDIDGRLGLTGKVGALVPLKDSFIGGTSGTDPGLAAGGGLILGLGCLALEMDVTQMTKADVNLSGSKVFEASLTDVAVGLQYRLATDSRLVPYLGGGADFIRGELKNSSGATYHLDWTFGGHANLGLDYFITHGIALNLDARGIFAADGDVNRSGTTVAHYDPMSFVGTVGVRLFLPENAFR
jgi:outer membrane protein